MSDKKYCYPPDFKVLRNKLNIRDEETLARAEREFVAARMTASVPQGKFDLANLQEIHFHLFQDIYDWAGQIRGVEIAKGGTQFQLRRFIATGMADIHKRLENQNFLKGLSREDFAVGAGKIIGDVNHVHPFREGNGRTQLVYLKQLASQAGHSIDLSKLDKSHWLSASQRSHMGDYDLMVQEISYALGLPRERSKDERDKKQPDKATFQDKQILNPKKNKNDNRYR